MNDDIFTYQRVLVVEIYFDVNMYRVFKQFKKKLLIKKYIIKYTILKFLFIYYYYFECKIDSFILVQVFETLSYNCQETLLWFKLYTLNVECSCLCNPGLTGFGDLLINIDDSLWFLWFFWNLKQSYCITFIYFSWPWSSLE